MIRELFKIKFKVEFFFYFTICGPQLKIKDLNGSFSHLIIAFFRKGLWSCELRIWRNLLRTVAIKSESITTYETIETNFKVYIILSLEIRSTFLLFFIEKRKNPSLSF